MILNSIGSIGRHQTLLLQRLSSIGSTVRRRTWVLFLRSIGSIGLGPLVLGSIGLGLLVLET